MLTMDTSKVDNSQLVFGGVTELMIPHHEPWGASVSINSLAICPAISFWVKCRHPTMCRLAQTLGVTNAGESPSCASSRSALRSEVQQYPKHRSLRSSARCSPLP